MQRREALTVLEGAISLAAVQAGQLLEGEDGLGNGRVERARHAGPLAGLVLEGDLDSVDGQRWGAPHAAPAVAAVLRVQLLECLLQQAVTLTLHLQPEEGASQRSRVRNGTTLSRPRGTWQVCKLRLLCYAIARTDWWCDALQTRVYWDLTIFRLHRINQE